MAKEICISSTPHETRLAILEDDQLTEIYYERENEYTLAGSIYKGRVTRVLPGMQSAFVDLGLERDAFLYVTDFMEEQEDGADFERVPNGNGSAPREGQAPREPRASREPREGHSARAPISIDPEAGTAARSSESPSAGHSGEEESGQGTRRWRGRRGRRRGGRPQGPREAGEASYSPEPGAPQNFVSEIVIGHETAPEAFPVAEPGLPTSDRSFYHEPAPIPQAVSSQPIVLPGESLSRYGSKPAETASRPNTGFRAPAAQAASSAPAYKPSTLVEVVPNWDGGAELPGETLSRYRGKAASPAAPIAAAQASPIPAAPEIVELAWETPAAAHATAEEPLSPAAAEETPTFSEHPTQSWMEAVSGVTEDEIAQPEDAPFARQEPSGESLPGAETVQTAEEEHPLEPENASASYRVDAAAPSEYRVSSALEPETEEAPAVLEQVAPAVEHPVTEAPEPEIGSASPLLPSFSSFHKESEAGGHAAPPEEASSGLYEEAVAPATHVDPSFEAADSLAADPLLETGEAEPWLVANAAAPTVGAPSHAIETEFFDDGEDDGPRSFAPGLGTIEEEIIDEEEYDYEPIHAHSDEHDLDDLEEETLDNLGGGELGEMVRDAHLEQRIGVSTDSAGVAADLEYNEAEGGIDDEEDEEEEAVSAAPSAPAPREGRAEDGRRGGRGPRRRGRPNGGGGGGSRRANAQLSDLPIISELLKQGQEILVQIAKEPIAKKGARITSHIALPGRFLVFMPTVNHVGVSRKIVSDEERQRLKRILISEKGSASGGFIVRTAADGAGEDDLRADIRFLISLWNDIKQRADDGKAPALIYHDLNLIERVLRDQVSANFSTIWVDNEGEYERIVRFLNRFEPSLVRRVKLYTKEMPLFEQFGIQDEIGKALKSKVWLKSGGSIVINQTEALVAIDINTGKYVGKTARLEDTIVKTNLDAIPEIVRQMRLRDLGGIIIIDFIDMDDRRNRHKVMAALEEELKHDRAPSKVLQFNDFGLVAITRKRVKQSLERTLSVQCEICAGTGMVKSPTTVCNEIYTELRKMQRHLERGDVLLRVHPEVVKTLKANNAKWLNELEEMAGKTIIVKSDPALHPEQFDIQ